MRRTSAIILGICFLAMAAAPLAAPTASAAGGFDVTDGTGRTFHYDSPSERVVVTGYAATLTLIDLGHASRVAATDTYGSYEYQQDEKLAAVKDAPSIGSIASQANNKNVETALVQMVDEGKLSLEDTIIFTTYVTNGERIRELLDGRGFTHVLMWGSITEYGKIIEMVDDLSMIMSGEKSQVAEDMRAVQADIAQRTAGIEPKAKAVFVWWSSSSGFKVGKSGSLAVSLIEAAGGVSLGESDASGGSYGDKNTIVQILEGNQDALVLLDSSYMAEKGVQEFRGEVLGGNQDIRVLGLQKTWNNYCPESAEGLREIAKALYPGVFGVESGDDGKEGSESEGGSLLIAAIAIVAIVALIAVAWMFLRKA